MIFSCLLVVFSLAGINTMKFWSYMPINTLYAVYTEVCDREKEIRSIKC